MIGEHNYDKIMGEFEDKLIKNIHELVKTAKQRYEQGAVHQHLLNMLSRLDFNNYYSRVFTSFDGSEGHL